MSPLVSLLMGLMDETAVKLVEGHQPDDELTEGHLPDYQPAETITVECLTLGQESPPGGAWEEDSVFIHTCKDEMDRLC